jgi:multidrug efflux pump subunit AcrA (membrane-fusion protein)
MKYVLLLLTVLGAAGCAADPEPARDAAPSVLVQTAPARLERQAVAFESGGTVRAKTTTVLSSRVMSAIVNVAVKPGDRVRAGQVLVRLDARQLAAGQARADAGLAATLEADAAADAERDAATSALTLARASHARIATLAERKVATPAEIDAAVAALRGAEARLKAANARKAEVASGIEAARAAARNASVDASFAAIVAPFDGLVTEKMAEPGTIAMPGTPLLVVEDVRVFRLEVSVDVADTATVTVGSRVPVAIGGLAPLDGTVEEIAPSVDAVAHAYTIKIALPGTPGLRSGLYGRARFGGADRQLVAVPAGALVRRGQLTLVFVDDNGTARLRYVHVGTPAGDRIPVLSGLAENERVIVEPPPSLADGVRLRQGSGGRAPAGDVR